MTQVTITATAADLARIAKSSAGSIACPAAGWFLPCAAHGCRVRHQFTHLN
jgi:hypothetical protein